MYREARRILLGVGGGAPTSVHSPSSSPQRTRGSKNDEEPLAPLSFPQGAMISFFDEFAAVCRSTGESKEKGLYFSSQSEGGVVAVFAALLKGQGNILVSLPVLVAEFQAILTLVSALPEDSPWVAQLPELIAALLNVVVSGHVGVGAADQPELARCAAIAAKSVIRKFGFLLFSSRNRYSDELHNAVIAAVTSYHVGDGAAEVGEAFRVGMLCVECMIRQVVSTFGESKEHVNRQAEIAFANRMSSIADVTKRVLSGREVLLRRPLEAAIGRSFFARYSASLFVGQNPTASTSKGAKKTSLERDHQQQEPVARRLLDEETATATSPDLKKELKIPALPQILPTYFPQRPANELVDNSDVLTIMWNIKKRSEAHCSAISQELARVRKQNDDMALAIVRAQKRAQTIKRAREKWQSAKGSRQNDAAEGENTEDEAVVASSLIDALQEEVAALEARFDQRRQSLNEERDVLTRKILEVEQQHHSSVQKE